VLYCDHDVRLAVDDGGAQRPLGGALPSLRSGAASLLVCSEKSQKRVSWAGKIEYCKRRNSRWKCGRALRAEVVIKQAAAGSYQGEVGRQPSNDEVPLPAAKFSVGLTVALSLCGA